MRTALDAQPATLALMGREGRSRVEAQHDQEANAKALMVLIVTFVQDDRLSRKAGDRFDALTPSNRLISAVFENRVKPA